MIESVKLLPRLGYTVDIKTVYDILKGNYPIASIFVEDKYIQFYDQYSQIAPQIPELKTIIEEAENLGWKVNLS